jgi:ribosomal protein L35
MKKSISKRIRFTKNGKIVRRRMGVNHFRTRKSTSNIRSSRKKISLEGSTKSIRNSYA